MTVVDQTLVDALDAFKESTGLAADLVDVDVRLPEGYADAEIRLGGAPPLLAEIKRTIRPATAGVVMAQLQRFNRPWILVTEYVTLPIAEN